MQDGRDKDCPDNKGLNEVWLDHCLIAICLPSTIIQVHSPRPVITTLHLHTQLHCRSLRGRSLLCRRGRKTHNQLFKIQLKYEFRSLSQTHNKYHRRSALHARLRQVGRLWKHLSSNARLISPPRAAESC